MRSARPQQLRASLGLLGLAWATLLSCGTSHPSEEHTGSLAEPIVGGQIDTTTRGVVSINIDATGHYFTAECSGTLIAPNLVLTARHCVSFTSDSSNAAVSCAKTRFVRERVPETILISPSSEAPQKGEPQLYPVERIYVPDTGDSICGFDLALLELTTQVPASQATPLAPRLSSPVKKSERFSAVGFGLTEDGGGGRRMRSDVNLVTCAPGACTDPSIADSEWLSEAAPLCHGDSGGPALDEHDRVIGVASRGAASCSSVVYAAVSAFGELISGAARRAAMNGSYSVPSWALDATEPGVLDGGLRDAGTELATDASDDMTDQSESGCSVHSPSRSSLGYEQFMVIAFGLILALGRRRAANSASAATSRN